MENSKKYLKVIEISEIAKKLEDEMRDTEAEADVNPSAIKKVNENSPTRNFVVEAIDMFEKETTKDEDQC